MKKFLALLLSITCALPLVACGANSTQNDKAFDVSSVAATDTETTDTETTDTETTDPETEDEELVRDFDVYLAPGTNYNFSGLKVVNSFESGAPVVQLTAAQEAAGGLTNAYFCEQEGCEPLPIPVSPRVDLTFNGWQYIRNGEISYIEYMPTRAYDTSVATAVGDGVTDADWILYADWKSTEVPPAHIPDIPTDFSPEEVANGTADIYFAKPNSVTAANVYTFSGNLFGMDFPGTRMTDYGNYYRYTFTSLELTTYSSFIISYVVGDTRTQSIDYAMNFLTVNNAYYIIQGASAGQKFIMDFVVLT